MPRITVLHYFLLLAMNLADSRAESDSLGKAKATEAFILNGASNSIGKSRQEAEERLGQPTRIHIEKRTNPYLPGVIDSLVSIQYQGARVRYFVPGRGNPSKEFVTEAEATSKGFGFGQGISIGAKMNFVINALGFPNGYSPDSLVYDDESMNKVVLYFEKANLTKVRWIFYWE